MIFVAPQLNYEVIMCRVYTKNGVVVRQKAYIGDVFENTVGDKAVVVKYDGCASVTIKFLCDKPSTLVCQTSQLRRGAFKNPYTPFVQGVGYVGVGRFPVTIDGKATREYLTWKSMLVRCFCPITKKKYPTYKDCTVCEEWLDFQVFAEWLTSQVGYEEYDLDKDLLIKGNKHYSKETCTLLPSIMNITLNGGGSNGDKKLPKGVCKYNNSGRFMARHRGETLGVYDTVEEAFAIYKVAREDYIKQLALEYRDKIDPRAFKALMKWEVHIDD